MWTVFINPVNVSELPVGVKDIIRSKIIMCITMEVVGIVASSVYCDSSVSSDCSHCVSSDYSVSVMAVFPVITAF